MKEISNQDLQAELIPDPAGDLADWIEFALTINGYEVAGSFEACAALANNKMAKTLTELRCALFFEARRDRHMGGMGYIDMPCIRQLLHEIKGKVKSRDL